MKFKRTDDLPNDTELLKGAAASPDAHVTGRGSSHANRTLHNCPARHRGAAKMEALGSHF